jgi:hypothetical protein
MAAVGPKAFVQLSIMFFWNCWAASSHLGSKFTAFSSGQRGKKEGQNSSRIQGCALLYYGKCRVNGFQQADV